MPETLWWIMSIIGPVILLIALVWIVFRGRSRGSHRATYEATKDEYADEERRRREGTDGL